MQLTLSFLCLLSVTFGAEVNPGGEKCDFFRCLNRPGITCDRDKYRCDCPVGQQGNGRFECVSEATDCVCLLTGDPRVDAFGRGILKLPFPCMYDLADFETWSPHKQCSVKVRGVVDHIPQLARNPQTLYLESLEVEVSHGNTKVLANIDWRGFINKNYQSLNLPILGNIAPGIMLTCWRTGEGYFEVQVPGCGVKVKLRPEDNSMAIVTGNTARYMTGLCRRCKDDSSVFRRAARARNLDIHAYATYEAGLAIVANKTGEEHILGPQYQSLCVDYKNLLRNCPANLVNEAIASCHNLLNNLQLGQFFLEKGKDTGQLFSEFTNCVSIGCDPSKTKQDICNYLFTLMGYGYPGNAFRWYKNLCNLPG